MAVQVSVFAEGTNTSSCMQQMSMSFMWISHAAMYVEQYCEAIPQNIGLHNNLQSLFHTLHSSAPCKRALLDYILQAIRREHL